MKIIKSILPAIFLLAAFIPVKAQTATATALNNVITDYLAVKNALAADDGSATESKAKILKAQVDAVQTADMTAAQKDVWKNYVDKLSFDSRHMSETTFIDHQREHFESLSKNMYAVLKAFKVNSMVIYEQYCPMKKAYWLSETSAIKNPYLGKEMPDCGKTTETLKAAK